MEVASENGGIRFRRKIYDLLGHQSVEKKSHHIFHLLLIILIASNVMAALLETTLSLSHNHVRTLLVFDFLSVVLFSVEWLTRVWCCVENPKYSKPLLGRVRFIFTPLMLTDLLAILPFYIPLIIVLDLRFLRLLRLFHIARLYAERDDLIIKRRL